MVPLPSYIMTLPRWFLTSIPQFRSLASFGVFPWNYMILSSKIYSELLSWDFSRSWSYSLKWLIQRISNSLMWLQFELSRFREWNSINFSFYRDMTSCSAGPVSPRTLGSVKLFSALIYVIFSGIFTDFWIYTYSFLPRYVVDWPFKGASVLAMGFST